LCFAIPAGEVHAYVVHVVKQIRSRQLPFPPDVDINSSALEMDPVEVFRAATQSIGFGWSRQREDERAQVFVVTTTDGDRLYLNFTANKSAVNLSHYLCLDLSYDEREAPSLLVAMLEWHYEMPWGPRFCLDRDDPKILSLMYGRHAE